MRSDKGDLSPNSSISTPNMIKAEQPKYSGPMILEYFSVSSFDSLENIPTADSISNRKADVCLRSLFQRGINATRTTTANAISAAVTIHAVNMVSVILNPPIS